MNIIYKMEEDGGFLAGDLDSGIACYAYPTSTHATQAKRTPQTTAHKMLSSEIKLRHSQTNERDARWIAELIA